MYYFCSYDWDWPYNFNIKLTRKMSNIKLVLEILFCHPPGVSNQDGISAQPIRYGYYLSNKSQKLLLVILAFTSPIRLE